MNKTFENPGIYIHVPFCIKKCSYCNFFSISEYKNYYTQYIKTLLNELKNINDFFIKDIEPDTLYIGGGTPSLLELNDLEKILKYLYAKYNFKEVTIEINPGTVDEETIKEYYNLGINRVSIGVQSLDDKVLNFLGRIHTEKKALNSISLVKKFFDNFSADLIYAIPGFKGGILLKSMEKLTAFMTPHFSTYSLSIEPGTLLDKKNVITNDKQFQKEYKIIHNYLSSKGFEHYEVSNFAMPGFESLHNNKYWIRSAYLGFGPCAHSLWNNKRFSYDKLNDFFDSALFDKYTNASVLTEDEIREEILMLGMRTNKGVSLSLININNSKLKKLKEEGFLIIKNNRLFPTLKGWTILNSLILELL